MATRDRNSRNVSANGRHRHPNHHERQTGVWSSEAKDEDRGMDRKRSPEPRSELKSFHEDKKTFNIVVDSVPYMIEAIPFSFNGEVRYNVNFNGSPQHVFTWDSSLGQLRAIDDDSSTMPDNLEIAISEKLQSIK